MELRGALHGYAEGENDQGVDVAATNTATATATTTTTSADANTSAATTASPATQARSVITRPASGNGQSQLIAAYMLNQYVLEATAASAGPSGSDVGFLQAHSYPGALPNVLSPFQLSLSILYLYLNSVSILTQAFLV